jgi:ribosomal-protein-alanine N-acetyltransferase
MGAVAVSLEVRVTNWSAQRMYGRFGFRPVGIRKNYYQETSEDALIMWTDDIRTADYRNRLQHIIEHVPTGPEPA